MRGMKGLSRHSPKKALELRIALWLFGGQGHRVCWAMRGHWVVLRSEVK